MEAFLLGLVSILGEIGVREKRGVMVMVEMAARDHPARPSSMTYLKRIYYMN